MTIDTHTANRYRRAVPGTNAIDIPVAHTPHGGWTTSPPPVLAAYTEPLVDGAPDLRGVWRIVAVEVEGAAADDQTWLA